VHVALVEAESPTAAAVALPALDRVLSTAAPPRVAPAAGGPPRIVVSRTRPPALASFLAERLGGELVPMGSAGAKAMSIIRGESDVYAHGGGQYEWDSAAPVGVAASAGLHTSRLDGSPLRYNQPDPYLPDLLVCRPELAGAVLAAVAEWPGG
jgi:3'(2'), 5'-bisphosphate nucleotidase